jgi:hypothetical protein
MFTANWTSGVSQNSVSLSNDLLADEFVVLGMASNPKPVHTARNRNTKRAVMQTDANAVHSPATEGFELK